MAGFVSTLPRYSDPVTFSWPIDRTNFPAIPTLPGSPTTEEQAAYDKAVAEERAAAALAVSVMYALTGRQWGLRECLVRPCRSQPEYWLGNYGYGGYSGYSGYDSGVTSYLLSWEGTGWMTWPCGCMGSCQITGPRAVHLAGPVHDILEVKIAGVVLDPSGYTVENNVIYRVGAWWPRQNLSHPLGEPNTWSVKYQRGIQVPEGLATLTGILAKEFLAAMAIGDGNKCRLPRTVTTASRNGVTYRVYDPAVIYAHGKTGLPEIDMFLASVNPHALSAAPSVI